LNKTKSYNRAFGYNININASSSLGVKRTEEYKKRLSVSHKGKTLSKEHVDKIIETKTKNGTLCVSRKGYKLKKSTIEKMIKTRVENGIARGSNNAMAKINENVAKEIILDLINGKTNKELCIKYNLSKNLISSINLRKTWKYIQIEGYENVEIYHQTKKRKNK